MIALSRMRTIKQTAEYFRQLDPETVVNEYYLRSIIKQGLIPVFKTGNKVLLNMDKLLEYFNGESNHEELVDAKPEGYGKIRRVEV